MIIENKRKAVSEGLWDKNSENACSENKGKQM